MPKKAEATNAYLISSNKRGNLPMKTKTKQQEREGEKKRHSHKQWETWTGRKWMGVWQNCHPGWARSSVAAIVVFSRRRHTIPLLDKYTQHAIKLHSNSVSVQSHFDTAYRATGSSCLVVAQSIKNFTSTQNFTSNLIDAGMIKHNTRAHTHTHTQKRKDSLIVLLVWKSMRRVNLSARWPCDHMATKRAGETKGAGS